MDVSTALQLIILAVVAIWGIYQVRITSRLEREVHQLNIGLDQSIQTLHRAREAVINVHKSHVYLLEFVQSGQEPNDAYYSKRAELFTYKAELRGLAFAIDDKEFLNLVNQSNNDANSPLESEMNMRLQSQQLHTRIAQLIKETATNKTQQ